MELAVWDTWDQVAYELFKSWAIAESINASTAESLSISALSYPTPATLESYWCSSEYGSAEPHPHTTPWLWILGLISSQLPPWGITSIPSSLACSATDTAIACLSVADAL